MCKHYFIETQNYYFHTNVSFYENVVPRKFLIRLDMILQVGGVLTNIVNDWIFDLQREQIAIKEGDGTLKFIRIFHCSFLSHFESVCSLYLQDNLAVVERNETHSNWKRIAMMLDLIYLFGIQLAHCYSRSSVESVLIKIKFSSSNKCSPHFVDQKAPIW